MPASSGLHATPEAPDTDVRLMLQVRDDVPGAFETLVRRHEHRLLGVLTHLLADRAAAEDLTQEVLLRVYRSRKSYRPTARFSTWLYTIANNLARNHRRGRARRGGQVSLGATDSTGMTSGERLPGRDAGASTQFRQVELSEVVRAAVDSLADDQRLAVLLNKFEDMGYAEIGAVMGRSEDSIRALLARARMNLKARLEPYLDDGRLPPAGPR